MRIKLEVATAADAPDLVCLRNATSERLTSQYGKGPWSAQSTERGALFGMRRGTVFIARRRNRLIASLTLSKSKPWAIDTTYFSPSELPLYLTGMAVSPDEQRKGIGRLCIEEARRIAKKWPGDAIRLVLSMPMRARANSTANADSARLAARRIEALCSSILKCCFDKKMATLGLIEYADATAEVRAVYDDIMSTRQTDYINNFWKAIAHDPATLRRTWESIKQIMAPGALDPLTKEMIYVAISASNQCGYCIASHTAAARKAGMTDAQFAELMAVVGMANETNRLVSGYQVEIDERFKT
jgi:AhpD family alkylhydroperoxidase